HHADERVVLARVVLEVPGGEPDEPEQSEPVRDAAEVGDAPQPAERADREHPAHTVHRGCLGTPRRVLGLLLGRVRRYCVRSLFAPSTNAAHPIKSHAYVYPDTCRQRSRSGYGHGTTGARYCEVTPAAGRGSDVRWLV